MRAKQITDLIKGPQIDASLSTLITEPASRGFAQGLVNAATEKRTVRAATNTNITLATPGSVFDGATFTNSGVDRLLLYGQTTASQNGIWIWNGANAALTRAIDAADVVGVYSGIKIPVGSEGTANGGKEFRLTTPDPITVGTTALTFVLAGIYATPVPSTANINMPALVTTADGQKATNTALATTPATGGQVQVLVNSDVFFPGNGVKTTACYFSADSGATAKTYATIAAGDLLYWNGSLAKYQLDATDLISFVFVA